MIRLVELMAVTWDKWPKGCISVTQTEDNAIKMQFPSTTKLSNGSRRNWPETSDKGQAVTKEMWEQERLGIFDPINHGLQFSEADVKQVIEHFKKPEDMANMLLSCLRSVNLLKAAEQSKIKIKRTKKVFLLEDLILDWLDKNKWPILEFEDGHYDNMMIYQHEDGRLCGYYAKDQEQPITKYLSGVMVLAKNRLNHSNIPTLVDQDYILRYYNDKFTA